MTKAKRSYSCSDDSQTICWLNLSQQPEIMSLQLRLFAQLTVGDDVEMPGKAKDSIDGQITELRRVAARRLVLVVLDGTSALSMLVV